MRINKIFLLLFNIHSDTPQSCSKLSLIIPTFALTHTMVLIIPSLPHVILPLTSLALIIAILVLIITP